MNDNTNNKLPVYFWIVAGLAVVWNLLGVVAFLADATMTAESLAALPEEQQALYAARPAWFSVAFALAVFGGLIGSILLAMRKSLATPIFLVSLLAVIAQNLYFQVLSDTFKVMGTPAIAFQSTIFIVAVGLVWFSAHAKGKSWIG